MVYDIESDPDIKHDFLHGFIRITNNLCKDINLKKIKYSPLLNLEKNTENFLWKRIKRKLNHHKRSSNTPLRRNRAYIFTKARITTRSQV